MSPGFPLYSRVPKSGVRVGNMLAMVDGEATEAVLDWLRALEDG